MIQLANEWRFYLDRNGQWQWRKLVSNKVVAVSFEGFTSRKECVGNAGQKGYIAQSKNVAVRK
jgi:uncharacterized protein YegP (UPF0339 family)